MKVLGIDTGFATTGYGLVEKKDSRIKYLAHGVFLTPKTDTSSQRLQSLYQQLTEFIDKEKPDVIGVEQLFYFRNATTIITVGEARGVILLAIENSMTQLVEVTPLQVKQFISAYGRADKKQVQEMVKRLLGLDFIPKPDDAADALAIAIYSSNIVKNDFTYKK
jgi:crossover junction endodeoxyribonuclease RuvC